MPIARLLIRAAAIVAVVPILVEPTVPNILALSVGLGLALAYTLKDYGSSFVAGLVTVLENTYQPGDWIEVDGAYGEVKSIAGRAVHLVTADDTEVIISALPSVVDEHFQFQWRQSQPALHRELLSSSRP